MDKQKKPSAAIAQLRDGMTVGIGGWGPRRKPMALVRELLRSDVKDLTLVAYGGADVGMLCAAGKVRKLIFAFVSLDFIPLEPYFRHAREQAKIDVMEIDEGMLMLGLQAAGMRLPFLPTFVGLGTDILVNNPNLKTIVSPYEDGKELVAMPALDLDVALIHVDRADQRGVCQINGPDIYMDHYFARAAKNTIVSCDELVPTDFFATAEQARAVYWERSETDAVVHIPCGAHPSSCTPLYGIDVEHFKTYAASAKQENGWKSYYNNYIACDDAVYLDKVGGVEAIKALPLPIY